MIEVPRDSYTKEFLGFPPRVSQKDLDTICNLVNPILIKADYSFTISNHMGEIIPVTMRINGKLAVLSIYQGRRE
jgi:flagellar assembly factor FliW